MALSIAELDEQTTFSMSSSTLTLSWTAAEVDSGDIIVVCYEVFGAAGNVNWTDPSGYTVEVAINNYDGDHELVAYAKVSDGSETSVAITPDGGHKTIGWAGVVASSTETLTLSNVESSTVDTGTGTSATPGSLDHTEDIALYIGVINGANPGTFDDTPDNSFTGIGNTIQTGGLGDDPGLYVAHRSVTTGGSYSYTDGWSTSDGFGDYMIGVGEPDSGTTVNPTFIELVGRPRPANRKVDAVHVGGVDVTL